MRIILWDIDGTLIRTGGAGMRALGSSLASSPAAAQALERMRLDGMTDRRIARILCAARRHHAQPDLPLPAHETAVTATDIDEMLADYLSLLPEHLQSSDGYRVLPGVVEALDQLEGRALHALGTGNHIDGARAKLEHGGLWHRFAFGGFGSDAEERADILRAAWKKAERHLGLSLDAADFVVVGDTPRDVAAAHVLDIACVCVATGRHDVHELAQAGAELVLADLTETDAAEQILSTRRGPGAEE